MKSSLLLLAACLLPLTGIAQNISIMAIERIDPRLDELIAPDATIERLSEGFDWSEGPVWVSRGGYLLFSDIPKNTIHRWKEGEGLSIFMRPAGFTGPNPFGRELGTNGLTLDTQGRLVVADHGDRRIARVNEEKWTKETLVDRYEGKRLNSPNDLVYRANGDLYFTDPPYGLEGINDCPAKEQQHNGVYMLKPDGKLTLMTTEFTFPNGIAFSPDQNTLYVAQSDPENAVIKAFDVKADGTLANGRVFFDAMPLVKMGRKGMPDGLKVDSRGNVWATGPGGVLILSPEGKHLGSILTGQLTANVAWGDDGSSLYMTADSYLLRVKTRTKGAGMR